MKTANVIIFLAAVSGCVAESKLRGSASDDESIVEERNLAFIPADGVDEGVEVEQGELLEEVMLKLAKITDGSDIVVEGDVNEGEFESRHRVLHPWHSHGPHGSDSRDVGTPGGPGGSDSRDVGRPSTYDIYYMNTCWSPITAYVSYYRNGQWYERSRRIRGNTFDPVWIAEAEHAQHGASRFYSCARAQNHNFRCWASWSVPKSRTSWTHEFSC